jgi:hypothetical protein
MSGTTNRSTRADWARWFLFHDEPDEAARVLEPGDELDLGRSDSLDLVAALGRRGLCRHDDGRRVSVTSDEASPRASPPARPGRPHRARQEDRLSRRRSFVR